LSAQLWGNTYLPVNATAPLFRTKLNTYNNSNSLLVAAAQAPRRLTPQSPSATTTWAIFRRENKVFRLSNAAFKQHNYELRVQVEDMKHEVDAFQTIRGAMEAAVTEGPTTQRAVTDFLRGAQRKLDKTLAAIKDKLKLVTLFILVVVWLLVG
jgi:hypothetical protein